MMQMMSCSDIIGRHRMTLSYLVKMFNKSHRPGSLESSRSTSSMNFSRDEYLLEARVLLFSYSHYCYSFVSFNYLAIQLVSISI